VEIPSLSVSSIWNLDDHVSIVDQIEILVVRKLRYDVEVFLDNESELFVHFSFAWFSLPLISIDNIPLLVDSIALSVDSNVSVFLVDVTLNLEYLALLVYNSNTLVSEHLPPS
jgi:hypothetical protein